MQRDVKGAPAELRELLRGLQAQHVARDVRGRRVVEVVLRDALEGGESG